MPGIIHTMFKGQVSTEYLVILAISLVLGLVLVYLIGGFGGTGAGTVDTQSQQAWGTAAPFAITDWEQSGTSMQLEIQNNDLEQLILTNISMDGASVFSTGTAFESGQKLTINATIPGSCAAGTSFSHDKVMLTYIQGGIRGKTEVGSKPLIGRCS